MDLIIDPQGTVSASYDETISLSLLGTVDIRRGSHVEPTADGTWTADMAPVGGHVLGPFASRSEALTAEVAWLRRYWLGS